MRISARGSAPRAAAALHLDAVHLEAAVCEQAEHDAAPAADVEHARAGASPRERKPRADQPYEALDQRLELRAGLPVVFIRVEGADLLRAQHRMEAPEAAAFADDELRRNALDGVARPRPLRAAHEAGVGFERRAGEGADLARVEPRDGIRFARGLLRHASARACLPSPQGQERVAGRP